MKVLSNEEGLISLWIIKLVLRFSLQDQSICYLFGGTNIQDFKFLPPVFVSLIKYGTDTMSSFLSSIVLF